jgi:integrase
MNTKLTKSFVERVPVGNRDKVIWDSEIKGFGLKVTPKGHRSYFVKYRVGGGSQGRQRKPSLGAHGILTCEQARQMARKWLAEARDGNDPLETRQMLSRAETISDLIAEFMERYAPSHMKTATQDATRDFHDRIINPVLGKMKVTNVTRADVSRLHGSLSATPYQANRVLSALSSLFNRAEEWGYRDEGTNPCRHVKPYPEKPRERSLSQEEIRRLNKTLITHEAKSLYSVAFVRLALMTGARKNELLTLQWSNVDLKQGRLQLPDSKTGKRTIVLSEPAKDLLAHLPRIKSNPYVLVGAKEGAHLVNVNKFWLKIRREANLDGARIHDLRHTFASIGVSNGVPLAVVGKLLGHRHPSTTNRYAHLADSSLTDGADLIGRELYADLEQSKETKSS